MKNWIMPHTELIIRLFKATQLIIDLKYNFEDLLGLYEYIYFKYRMSDTIFPSIRKFCCLNQFSSLSSIFSVVNNQYIGLNTVIPRKLDIKYCLTVSKLPTMHHNHSKEEFAQYQAIQKNIPENTETKTPQLFQIAFNRGRKSEPAVTYLRAARRYSQQSQAVEKNRVANGPRDKLRITHSVSSRHFIRSIKEKDGLLGETLQGVKLKQFSARGSKVSIAVGSV
jgi:hypothetical protein